MAPARRKLVGRLQSIPPDDGSMLTCTSTTWASPPRGKSAIASAASPTRTMAAATRPRGIRGSGRVRFGGTGAGGGGGGARAAGGGPGGGGGGGGAPQAAPPPGGGGEGPRAPPAGAPPRAAR